MKLVVCVKEEYVTKKLNIIVSYCLLVKLTTRFACTIDFTVHYFFLSVSLLTLHSINNYHTARFLTTLAKCKQ